MYSSISFCQSMIPAMTSVIIDLMCFIYVGSLPCLMNGFSTVFQILRLGSYVYKHSVVIHFVVTGIKHVWLIIEHVL